MPRTTIRTAVKEDVPLILSFIKEIAEFENLSHQVTADIATLEQELFSGQPSAEVLLLFVDEKPAAYAVYFHNFSTFLGKKGLYLEDIYVKPEYRQHGFGRKLFKHIVQIAVERNCGRMEWAVLDWNTPAINFYKRAGALVLDEWKTCRLTGDALLKAAE
ncbi:MAG: GNAT family N-acetyltransferase [Ignavibacteriales bacterium]|nr:GNAT family N-acetyltransferase [Ignavibacteriales bacterium]